MASRLKKYLSAFASAKEYVAQWSAEHVYADQVLIVPFPTLAIFNSEKNLWLVQIKAWVYLPFEGKKIKGHLSSIPSVFARKIPEKTTEDDHSTDDDTYEDASSEFQVEFGEPTEENPGRLGLFFVGNSVKVATKSIINGVEHLLQPSDESGFVEEQLEFSDQEIQSLCSPIYSQSDDRKFEYEIQPHESKAGVNYKPFKCPIYVLAPFGVSVISDIDDTIKITQVLSKRALLKHTFYSYFKPVEGMNELYQLWFTQNCQFHYVSASPWQLYPALRCFLEKYQYPSGTMNLRKFSWSLKFLKPPDTYKLEIITQIIDSYPTRKYICVGDSGEIDPEIYSKLFLMYPENIAHIFIRDICVLTPCPPTCRERYEKAFEGVPRNRWTVFKDPKDPKDVTTDIQTLIAE